MRDDLESEEERRMDVESSTVEELLEELDVEPEEVLVARNGTIVSGQHEIEEGDEIRVMDVIAGG